MSGRKGNIQLGRTGQGEGLTSTPPPRRAVSRATEESDWTISFSSVQRGIVERSELG